MPILPKLLIGFEPNWNQKTLLDSNTTDLNQQNSIIVDIQDTQDFTFHVDWTSDRMWLATATDVQPVNGVGDLRPYIPVTDRTTADIVGFDNTNSPGYIYVQVLNELVQPTDTATVKINCYVSSPNLELNVPVGTRLTQDKTINTESSTIESTDDTLVPTDGHENKSALPYFGERVVSFSYFIKKICY